MSRLSLSRTAPEASQPIALASREGLRHWRIVLSGLAEMSKPGITVFVLFTSATALWLAPAALPAARALLFLAAVGLLVSCANMLNCWLERDVDARMRRTRARPLPARRLEPGGVLGTAILGTALALPALAWSANLLTAALGALSLVAYVGVYTPLKRLTPRALELGAIPGAIPPLMGWAAATGTLERPAWMLFAVLYAWQLPHFLAIATYLREDYARAGIRVLPVARGSGTAARFCLAYSTLLTCVSTLPAWLGVTGWLYGAVAAAAGAVFVALAWLGVRNPDERRWAWRVFLYSLVYLPLVYAVFLADVR